MVRTGEPSADEKKVKNNQGFFCSLYQDFTIGIHSKVKSEDIKNAGQLADANTMTLHIYKAGKPLGLILSCLDKNVCKITSKMVTQLQKTEEAAPPFNELYNSCFGQ